jgi:hypothetical protein
MEARRQEQAAESEGEGEGLSDAEDWFSERRNSLHDHVHFSDPLVYGPSTDAEDRCNSLIAPHSA